MQALLHNPAALRAIQHAGPRLQALTPLPASSGSAAVPVAAAALAANSRSRRSRKKASGRQKLMPTNMTVVMAQGCSRI